MLLWSGPSPSERHRSASTSFSLTERRNVFSKRQPFPTDLASTSPSLSSASPSAVVNASERFSSSLVCVGCGRRRELPDRPVCLRALSRGFSPLSQNDRETVSSDDEAVKNATAVVQWLVAAGYDIGERLFADRRDVGEGEGRKGGDAIAVVDESSTEVVGAAAAAALVGSSQRKTEKRKHRFQIFHRKKAYRSNPEDYSSSSSLGFLLRDFCDRELCDVELIRETIGTFAYENLEDLSTVKRIADESKGKGALFFDCDALSSMKALEREEVREDERYEAWKSLLRSALNNGRDSVELVLFGREVRELRGCLKASSEAVATVSVKETQVPSVIANVAFYTAKATVGVDGCLYSSSQPTEDLLLETAPTVADALSRWAELQKQLKMIDEEIATSAYFPLPIVWLRLRGRKESAVQREGETATYTREPVCLQRVFEATEGLIESAEDPSDNNDAFSADFFAKSRRKQKKKYRKYIVYAVNASDNYVFSAITSCFAARQSLPSFLPLIVGLDPPNEKEKQAFRAKLDLAREFGCQVVYMEDDRVRACPQLFSAVVRDLLPQHAMFQPNDVLLFSDADMWIIGKKFFEPVKNLQYGDKDVVLFNANAYHPFPSKAPRYPMCYIAATAQALRDAQPSAFWQSIRPGHATSKDVRQAFRRVLSFLQKSLKGDRSVPALKHLTYVWALEENALSIDEYLIAGMLQSWEGFPQRVDFVRHHPNSGRLDRNSRWRYTGTAKIIDAHLPRAPFSRDSWKFIKAAAGRAFGTNASETLDALRERFLHLPVLHGPRAHDCKKPF